MKIEWIEECASTNSYAAALPPETGEVVVATRRQTAGRGQKGNTWESEPERNLTFSAVWRPTAFAARWQFAISEAVALAVCDLLAHCGIEAKVKWPNDIYVGDRKICGILIEHSVMGTDIDRTIAGVGINVNQRVFRSDAPNPVSMAQIADREFPLPALLNEYVRILEARLADIMTHEGRETINAEFKERMWRFDGEAHPFRDRDTGHCYRGIIRDVEPSGLLTVECADAGACKKYAFKEVEFLLSELF